MIVDLRHPTTDPGLLGRAYREVLRPSFTPEELPPPDRFEAMFDESGATIASVLVEDGEPAAVAVTVEVPELGLGLLVWLAARPGQRSRGGGARLLAHLRERWRSGDPLTVLGEVHDPRAWPTTDEEDAEARLRFYERNGALVVDTPWVQPRLQPEAERVADMLLLALHADDRVRAEGLPTDLLRPWAEAYFAGEEGAVPTDEQYRALAARWDRPTLDLLPVDRYREVEPLTPRSDR